MIKIQNLTKKMKSNIILDDINLEFQKGDFVGIVGINGAGKTTLLKLLLRIYNPSAGEIEVNENEPLVIDYFPDVSNMASNMKVIDYVNYYCSLHGFSNEKIMPKFYKLIEKFELETKLKNNIKTLSTGEKKRLYMVLLILFKKDLIFLDEPTDNLDEKYNNIFLEILLEMKSNNVTVFIISHNFNLLEKTIDKLVVLNEAKVLYSKEFLKGEKIKEIWDDCIKNKKTLSNKDEANNENIEKKSNFIEW